MAQKQQTVLRVQTNKPDTTITMPIGTLAVVTNSGDTFNFTYGGTGVLTDPYTGTTSSTSGKITFVVNTTPGTVYYDITTPTTGFTTVYLNYGTPNEKVILTNNGNTIISNLNPNVGDTITLSMINGATLNSLYFEPISTTVYQYDFLDLYGDIPIKITKSFAELQDISKRNSDYSIGLQLPGSKKNNAFFESFFNVDVSTLYFSAINRVPCDVLLSDESYFKGYLKLNKISIQNTKIEYDVTLYSTIADLFGQIGNGLMKDLNYSDVDYGTNHTFSKTVVQTWGDYNPYTGDEAPKYFYPIVHNGYEYSGDTVNISGATSGSTRLYTSTIVGTYASNAAAYAAGVKRYRINSPEDGLIDNQLKPALNIKNLVQLIFKTYGYTIDSDFFNTPWFRMLYMYGYFSSDTTKFSYKTPVPQTLPLDGVEVLLVETYTDYSLDCLGISYPATTRDYNIYVVKAGTGIPAYCAADITVGLDFTQHPCYGTSFDETINVTIPAYSTGTTYTWVSNAYVDCGSGSCVLEYTENFGANTTVTTVPVSTQVLAYPPSPANTTVFYEDFDYVDFGLVIDQNIKQIDFLASIAKKFNLVFVTDQNDPTKIKIEPYSYYVGTGNIYDWTDKMSYDKGFTVEPALNYVESELILTDLEDGDYGNKAFKDQNNRIYGQNFVYNPTDFKSQQKKIDTIFSPELLRKWDTPDTAPNGDIKLPLGINYAASSASQSSGGSEKVTWQYKGVKTKPKMFYWVGNFNPFLDTLGEVLTYQGSVFTNQIYVAESNGANSRGSWAAPIISHTMPVGNPDSNKITNDSICNLFNSEQPVDLGVAPFQVYTENDIYRLFYEDRVNNLYDKDTRFISGYFDLKQSDIQNLRANDLIKINQQYFSWNKIDSYNLTTPELTKVQLVQVNNEVSTYPTRYFKYFYCDNPSVVFKFATDFTNPSLSGTSYGWSALYDYNVGVLLSGSTAGVTGYTSSIRDNSNNLKYVGYYIYEVSETTYNSGGIPRQYDTLWNMSVDNDGDLNPYNFPSYVFGDNGLLETILFNLFENCSQWDSAVDAYGILTGSSTYHGTAVTPTPTATALPAPTPTPTPGMIGSLMMSFYETPKGKGGPYYKVIVNGSNRDLHYTDTTDLYSTNLNLGDVVEISIENNPSYLEVYGVIRRDYTTDDSLGDMGIVDSTISSTTGGTGTSVIFTASTISSAYNFEYRVEASCLAPQPTPTPSATATPTPTPSSTPTPTPTPTPAPPGIYRLTNLIELDDEIFTYVDFESDEEYCTSNQYKFKHMGIRANNPSQVIPVSALTLNFISDSNYPITYDSDVFDLQFIGYTGCSGSNDFIKIEWQYGWNAAGVSTNYTVDGIFQHIWCGDSSNSFPDTKVTISNKTNLSETFGQINISGGTTGSKSGYTWFDKNLFKSDAAFDLEEFEYELLASNELTKSSRYYLITKNGTPVYSATTNVNIATFEPVNFESLPYSVYTGLTGGDVLKWKVEDTFTYRPTPTPTPIPPTATPTPTASSTPTPTPSPSPTATSTPTPTPTPLPSFIEYEYVGSSPTGTTKNSTNLRTTFSTGPSYVASGVTWTSSTSTVSAISGITDSGSIGTPIDITVYRTINKSTTSTPEEYVNIRTVRLYRNGVAIDANVDTTNYTIPLTPSLLQQSYTFTGVTINAGDTIRAYWNDSVST
jgi:hypothetical protein